MNKEEYLKIVKKHTPKENNKKDYLLSFISGGTIGLICELMRLYFVNHMKISNQDAVSYILIEDIFISCLLTGVGILDDIISKFKSGIIIPISGFAHSVTAAALDYKRDGLITGLGANFFKLAGSVLLYAIISAFFMGIVKVIINV